MEQTADRCPKCGQPRWPGAQECPFCGVVYARASGRAAGSPPASAPASGPLPPLPELADLPDLPPAAEAGETTAGGDVYQGPTLDEILAAKAAGNRPGKGTPAARARTLPAGGRGERSPQSGQAAEPGETVFTRNLDLSLGFALLLLIVVNVLINGQVAGANTDAEEVADRFFALTSLDAPEDLLDAQDLVVAGHHVLMFTNGNRDATGGGDDFVLAYQGPGASTADTDGLLRLAEERLEVMDVATYGESDRPVEVSLARHPARRLNLGTPDRPLGLLVSFVVPGNNGRPVLVVVMGRPVDVVRRLAGWA